MESRKREKLMNNCNYVDQFPHRKPVQQFREARKMPLQLFIFKSNHLYTGIKPFCGILMFVADFNSLPLRLRCSVITHQAQKTEALAEDNRPLAEVSPRARAPGGPTILVSLQLSFLLLLVWGSKVPSYEWTETHFMYTVEKPTERKSLRSPPAWMHQPLSLPEPRSYSRAPAAFGKMGFAVEGIERVILFPAKRSHPSW